jgi:hypothetical protein
MRRTTFLGLVPGLLLGAFTGAVAYPSDGWLWSVLAGAVIWTTAGAVGGRPCPHPTPGPQDGSRVTAVPDVPMGTSVSERSARDRRPPRRPGAGVAQ